MNTRLALKIARELYKKGMLKEAKNVLGVRRTKDVLPTLMGELQASGEPLGKIAGEVSNTVATEPAMVEMYKKLKRGKHFSYFGGDPNYLPILGRAIVDTKLKPRLNAKYMTSLEFKSTRAIYQPHNTGEALYSPKNNPVIEAMDGWTMAIDNSAADKTWSHLVFGKPRMGRAKIVPTSGTPTDVLRGDPHAGIKEVIAPVFEEHFSRYSAWLLTRARMRALMRGVKKLKGRKAIQLQRAADAASPTARKRVLKEIEKGESKVLDKWKELNEKAEALEAKWRPAFENAMLDAAKKYPDARVYLAADSTWHSGKRTLIKQLDDMMSPSEKEAASRLKKYFKVRGRQLKRAGIKTIGDDINDFNYMPHVIRKHLVPALKREFRDKYALTPEVLDFPHRLRGSVPWFPSARAALEWYIPNVNRRLAFQPFHNKWAKHINSLGTSGPKGKVRNWWQAWFENNMNYQENTITNKLIDAYTNVEYMRLIGFSPSVAFKHALKLHGTFVEHGFGPTMKGFKEAMKFSARALKDPKVSPYLKNSKDLARWYLAKRYLKSKILYQSLIEMPGWKGMGANLRKWTSQPTAMVEFLDRGVSLYASIIAGAKRGIDYTTIHKGIWNTILDVNFMGAFDMYTWQQKPLVRALTMFTMTPMKIFEHKIKLINQALKGKKDIYGRSYGPKIVRGMIAIGIAESIARTQDSSVWEYMLHPPFLYTDYLRGKKHALYEPPIVRHIQSVKDDGFLQGLQQSFGYMGTFEKLHRINEGDIPRQYKHDPWRYILTLPYKTVEEHMLARRNVLHTRKRRRRTRRRRKTLGEQALEVFK